nr:PREDICTED: 85/88 kDa calcium-independent phospholipase A2 [Lepisosteus oculatus]
MPSCFSSAAHCPDPGLRASLCQINSRDGVEGRTPLHLACSRDDAGCALELLLECQARADIADRKGETPLHCAARLDSPAVMELWARPAGRAECPPPSPPFVSCPVLLWHCASLTLRFRIMAVSFSCLQLDHMELIKALIVFGADVETPNDFGETPGLIAARISKGANRKVLLSMLYSVGADRCHPPSPDTCLPTFKRPRPPPTIGFDDIMHVAATLGALTHGQMEVDGCKTGNRKCARLLCLDGGGIKGLVLIQLLIALEQAAGQPMGFSTCLSACPGQWGLMCVSLCARVMVTSVLADRHPAELHLFRNYDPPDPDRDPPYARSADFRPLLAPQEEEEEVMIVGYTPGAPKRRKVTEEEQLVWRAARSSGAAPSYFRPMGRFLDGGLLANNPTLDAMTEIHRYNKTAKAQGRRQEVQRLGVVVSLGTGKPPQVAVNSVDVFRPSNPLELAKSFVGAKELGKMLVDCCTDSDGCAVDRARSWCEMTETTYFRLSPQFSMEVMLDEVNDAVLVNMLWETQMYLYQQREKVQALAQQLLQG